MRIALLQMVVVSQIKKYTKNYYYILGYSRPNHGNQNDFISVDNSIAITENVIKEWQKSAIADGFSFSKYGADGKWGDECVSVAKKAIIKKRDTYKYINLTKIVQRIVGVTVDGKCGKDTDTAIRKYQKIHGLTVDGVLGLNTWKVILGIK